MHLRQFEPATADVVRLAGILSVLVCGGLAAATPAAAQNAPYQDQLFQQMVRHPTDYELTYQYARVASENGDYEAAIGALERLLFYNPRLTRVKYELGSLYFRLGSFEMAKRYFHEALASPDLDPVTRARIQTYLPDAEKQLQPSRFSGFAQTGFRSQSNANYAPTTGSILLGGTPITLLPTAQKGSDANWFGLLGLSHDYDLGNQGSTVLETRFAGYLTAQQKFDDLNVGLFDISFGPRFEFLPSLLSGATVKPYVVGGNTWIGGSSYLGSTGAGVSFNFPVTNRFSWAPNFEWRHADFNNGALDTVSGFGSGDWYTAGASGSYQISQTIRFEGRGFYRRGESNPSYQSFDQWAFAGALTFEFAPPLVDIPRNWSVSPFAKYTNTKFDAPNPFIDPFITRQDDQWSVGAILNAPFTRTFGVSAAVQYDHNWSTIANYRLNNFSVMAGPTARF
ncbi:MAG: tetratricopeptide repeat protein [Xanthobacteraceae bacterium]|nr:tetratricopeptide repeat protein [Xanthobacteraceae bacterium]